MMFFMFFFSPDYKGTIHRLNIEIGRAFSDGRLSVLGGPSTVLESRHLRCPLIKWDMGNDGLVSVGMY